MGSKISQEQFDKKRKVSLEEGVKTEVLLKRLEEANLYYYLDVNAG